MLEAITFALFGKPFRSGWPSGQAAIDIQLDKCQKTLITGKNGGGKSTMLEAITFALFGKPFRGAGSKLVFASGKTFTVAKSSATAISNPASETYTDVFKVDADLVLQDVKLRPDNVIKST
ncbi:DNA replication and repair protein RecF [Klebsiella phage vB_Kpn_AM_K6]